MTPATDDDAFVEAAFEALLAGRRVPSAAEGLVAFADGVRATAARAPRPSAALADLLATGLLTDQSSAPAPRAAARSRRRSSRMFLAFFAKIAAAGVAAKTAVVGGVVVVGLSTAGFTGNLPDPVQHDFAAVVDAATPLTAPDPSKTATPALDPTTHPATTQAGDPSGTATPPATTVTAPQAPAGNGIGGTVSAGRHDGTLTGSASELAHKRNADRRAAEASSAGSSPEADDPAGDDQGEDQRGDDHSTTSTTSTTGTTGTSGGSVSRDSSESGSKHGGHGNG